MVAVSLYFVAFAFQIASVLTIMGSSSWEVATLFQLGFQPTPAWASFFCLLTLCVFSILIPLVQSLSLGCRCCTSPGISEDDRHLTPEQYRSQTVLLAIQSFLWFMASGYSTAVLVTSHTTDHFGDVTYLGIAASWAASLATLVMMVFVIHIRRSRKRRADYLRKFHLKADVKEQAGILQNPPLGT